MAEHQFRQRETGAVRATPAPPPIVLSPPPAPDPAHRVQALAQEMTRFTARPAPLQRQAARPVLDATLALQRLQAEQQAERAGPRLEMEELQARPPARAEQTALQRSPSTPATLPPAFRRQASGRGSGITPTAADWAGLYAHEMARHTPDPRGFYPSALVAPLQRRVALGLAQAARTSSLPPARRYADLGQALAALQRQPLGSATVQGSLGQMPPGERPAIQRALDEANQALQRQEEQDARVARLQTLQRHLAELDAGASQPVWQQIQARRGAGHPLPGAVQRHLEQGLNHDLSRVRIHDDAEADRLAKGVNAVAFTTGTDIFFRSGKYRPNTRSGLELLAHEVTHTVQQAQGRVGRGVDPDAGLEAEARSTGTRLASRPLRLEGVKGRPGLAPLTTGHALQRLAAPPSWKVTASPERLEQMVQKDLSGFLRQMLGRSLLDQTHYSGVNRSNPAASPSFGRIFLDSLDHLPLSAASKQKVLDAAIQKPLLPDWTRVQIAQSAVQTGRTDRARAQGVIKAIGARAHPDHITDFGGALLSRVVDTVVSLYKLAKFVQWDNSVVRMLVDPVGYRQMWVNIGATLSTIVHNPRLLWEALTKDVREAWQKGQYGKSLGYLTFDVATAVTGLPGAGRAAATVPGRMRVVVALAKDASGQVTSKVVRVGDDIARGMEMTAGDLSGGRLNPAPATVGGAPRPQATPRPPQGMAAHATGPIHPMTGAPSAARVGQAAAQTQAGGVALADPLTLKGLPRQLNLAQRCSNWAQVKPFIGTKAGPTRLPPDYLYAKIPKHGGGYDEFAYLPDADLVTDVVPRLKKDGAGNWQPDGLAWQKAKDGSYRVGRDYRLAQNSEYGKTNPVPEGFEGKGAVNNHHMTPDEAMRRDPVFQELFRRGLVSPDRATNMINLAVDQKTLAHLRAAGFEMSDILHYTSHPRYTALVEDLLATRLREFRMQGKLPDDLTKASAQDLTKFVGGFDRYMRDSFFRNAQRLKGVLRKNGALGALPNTGEKQA